MPPWVVRPLLASELRDAILAMRCGGSSKAKPKGILIVQCGWMVMGSKEVRSYPTEPDVALKGRIALGWRRRMLMVLLVASGAVTVEKLMGRSVLFEGWMLQVKSVSVGMVVVNVGKLSFIALLARKYEQLLYRMC